MKRILAYMDFGSPTGFGNVSKNLFERLTPFFEANDIHVDVCATNYGNKETWHYHKNVTIYNAKSFAKNLSDKWYRDGFLKLLQSKPYNLVWMMNDLSVVNSFMPLMKTLKEVKAKLMHPNFDLILYTPVDSAPHADWFKYAKEYDKIFTYTKYGYDEIQKIKKLKNLEIIPHGFDTENFKSEFNKLECRRRVGIPKDKWVIGTVNKNQPRKDVANTLIAFSLFKKQCPEAKDAFLYLHTYFDDPTGVNLRILGDQLGLIWDVDYSMPMHKKYFDGDFTLSDMNDVYNSFDLFVTTSMAEGWGLTLTEALCCRLNVIYGNHTSLAEIAGSLKEGKCEKLIPHVQIADGNSIRFKLNPYEVAEKMAHFYKNRNAIRSIETNDQYDRIINKYDWNKIALEWSSVFAKLLK